MAQTNEAPVDDQAIEEIVVTGSRLLRRDFSTPSPITTINREALAFSGQTTLETTLNKMPQINWSTERPSALAIGDNAADLVVDVVWTHMLVNSFQETSYGTVFDCAGYFGWPCNDGKDGTTYPSNRVSTNFNYMSGNFNVFLNWRWIEGTDNAAPFASGFFGFPDPDLAVPTVSTRNYFDLGLGYRFSENIIARLAIANLTETSPAFMADAGNGTNTDSGMYDLFGRSYTLSFSLQY